MFNYPFMKRNSLILLLFLLSISTLSAQKKGDLLYLKNGSIINGILIESTSDFYKIKTSDGSMFVYPAADVEKAEINRAMDANESVTNSTIGFGLEAGFLVGIQSSEYVTPLSFNLIVDYQVTHNQSLAIGSGVEFLGVSYTPLFAEYRFLINDNSTSPFGFVRGGYVLFSGNSDEDNNYGGSREYSGGPTMTIGSGINWDKGTHNMYLSFAYRYIRTEYIYDDDWSAPATYKTNWNRLEIKFGFRF